MNTIIPKSRLPTLNSSTHKIKNRIVNRILKSNDVYRTQNKDTVKFLQNGFSRISLGYTTVIQGPVPTLIHKRNCPDAPGSGAGEHGGGAARIGGVGKFGNISEEQFFYKKNRAQIEQLKLELEKKGQEKQNAPEKKEE